MLFFCNSNAKNNGVTKEEMAGIITHIAFYVGWPKAWTALIQQKKYIYKNLGGTTMKQIGTKNLETERLILRKLTIEDAPYAYEHWCSNPSVCKYTMWDKHNSAEDTKKLYEIWEKEYEDPTIYRWLVEIKESHTPIGTIDVCSKKYLRFGTCEIGYCYDEDAWGKGYGTESLKAVIKYLFEEAEAETIYAEYMLLNPGSGKVMEKSGMIFEGTQKSRVLDKDGNRSDLGVYSLTKEEYFKNEQI